MHPLLLLSITGRISATLLLPVWCLSDGYKIWLDITDKEKSPGDSIFNIYFITMLLGSGVLSFVQNLLAFTLIHKLSAVKTQYKKRVVKSFISGQLRSRQHHQAYNGHWYFVGDATQSGVCGEFSGHFDGNSGCIRV